MEVINQTGEVIKAGGGRRTALDDVSSDMTMPTF